MYVEIGQGGGKEEGGMTSLSKNWNDKKNFREKSISSYSNFNDIIGGVICA